MKWRLLNTPPMAAADNMALFNTPLAAKDRGATPNTFHFLQFSPNATLVDQHQVIDLIYYLKTTGYDDNIAPQRQPGKIAKEFPKNQLT